MKTYEYDAFGNPIKATSNGQPQTVFLYSDGIYDPMLTWYYLVARHHNLAFGRFTSLSEEKVSGTDLGFRFLTPFLGPMTSTSPSTSSGRFTLQGESLARKCNMPSTLLPVARARR